MNQKLAVLDGSDFLRLLYLLESDEEDKCESVRETITFALNHKSRLPNGQILTAFDPDQVPEPEQEKVLVSGVQTGSLIRVEGIGIGLYRWEVEEGIPVHYLYLATGKVVLKYDQRVTVLCDTFDMARATLAAIDLLDQALEPVEADERDRRESWPDEALELALGRDIRNFLSKFTQVLIS